MTDFRALCAEQLSEFDYYSDWSDAEEVKERARVALAEPEPDLSRKGLITLTKQQTIMNNEAFPITPPPELVEQWECEYHHMTYGPDLSMFISEKAANWGADQELEACVEWLGDAPVVYNDNGDLHPGSYLRDARRPRSTRLKEQALGALYAIATGADDTREFHQDIETIKAALEQLDD